MFAAIEKLIETLTKTQLGIMCKMCKKTREKLTIEVILDIKY